VKSTTEPMMAPGGISQTAGPVLARFGKAYRE
jgi:hypothetical protein